MTAATTVVTTGDLLEYELDTPEQLVGALKEVNDFIGSYMAIKAAIRAKAALMADKKGIVTGVGYQARVIDQAGIRAVRLEQIVN
jgi:hypothetical protein